MKNSRILIGLAVVGGLYTVGWGVHGWIYKQTILDGIEAANQRGWMKIDYQSATLAGFPLSTRVDLHGSKLSFDFAQAGHRLEKRIAQQHYAKVNTRAKHQPLSVSVEYPDQPVSIQGSLFGSQQTLKVGGKEYLKETIADKNIEILREYEQPMVINFTLDRQRLMSQEQVSASPVGELLQATHLIKQINLHVGPSRTYSVGNHTLLSQWAMQDIDVSFDWHAAQQLAVKLVADAKDVHYTKAGMEAIQQGHFPTFLIADDKGGNDVHIAMSASIPFTPNYQIDTQSGALQFGIDEMKLHDTLADFSLSTSVQTQFSQGATQSMTSYLQGKLKLTQAWYDGIRNELANDPDAKKLLNLIPRLQEFKDINFDMALDYQNNGGMLNVKPKLNIAFDNQTLNLDGEVNPLMGTLTLGLNNYPASINDMTQYINRAIKLASDSKLIPQEISMTPTAAATLKTFLEKISTQPKKDDLKIAINYSALQKPPVRVGQYSADELVTLLNELDQSLLINKETNEPVSVKQITASLIMTARIIMLNMASHS